MRIHYSLPGRWTSLDSLCRWGGSPLSIGLTTIGTHMTGEAIF